MSVLSHLGLARAAANKIDWILDRRRLKEGDDPDVDLNVERARSEARRLGHVK